jgi:hypothetical protein
MGRKDKRANGKKAALRLRITMGIDDYDNTARAIANRPQVANLPHESGLDKLNFLCHK